VAERRCLGVDLDSWRQMVQALASCPTCHPVALAPVATSSLFLVADHWIANQLATARDSCNVTKMDQPAEASSKGHSRTRSAVKGMLNLQIVVVE